MKIQSLQYEDLSTGWKLDLIDFNPQLTLLVGVSGVGKTQILNALLSLQAISDGCSLNGVKWRINFTTKENCSCEWSGEFEKEGLDSGVSFRGSEPAYLNNEQLVINGVPVIDRNTKSIFFHKEKIVRLSQYESIVFLLREEDEIKEIHAAFKKIISKESDLNYWKAFNPNDFQLKLSRYKSLEEIRNSGEGIKKKLFLISTHPFFNEIKNAFLDVFPFIEDLKIELNKSFIRDLIEFRPCIKIKEKKVSNWIDEIYISSGMIKTLIQVAELYLCPDNSVILIDEFENSLGINCIDEVVYQMLASERNLQFIITSHHPYIINKIGYEYWKIVTRKGSAVKCVDAKEFGIGKSRLQAFTQLGNLSAFAKGIES